MRSANVPLSPLVAIADDIFAIGLGIGDRFPFDAGREARAAAACAAPTFVISSTMAALPISIARFKPSQPSCAA